MNPKLYERLSKINALLKDDHFVYTSGKHGSAYFNKDAIYPHTELISDLCLEMATHFKDKSIEVVAAPVIGGVILSQWIAHHLSILTKTQVLAVYAEKTTEAPGFTFNRGYDQIISGRRVLIVEDILNTGGSAKKVIEATQSQNGEVVGVSVLCNRGKVTTAQLEDVPELFSLLEVNLNAYDENECPLCEASKPINAEVGKGKLFLSRTQKGAS